MHKLYSFGLVLFVVLLAIISLDFAHASGQDVVISQVQLGDKNSAKNEFIELHNNSTREVDITGWCLYYQSSSLKSEKLTCFVAASEQAHIFLPGNSSALAVSNELLASAKPLIGDVSFSATLSDTAGYVIIMDNAVKEVDKVGWGAATAELDLTPAAPDGAVISRKLIKDTDMLQDTDINLDDFEITPPRAEYGHGLIHEVNDACMNIIGFQAFTPDGYDVDSGKNCKLPPVDICPNIDGLQEVAPIGYGLDENSRCMADACANLDGLQLTLPDGTVVDETGSCVEFDFCPNLLEIQPTLPSGHYLSDDGECKPALLPLQISEILPNITGIDNDKEFIEIYNPNDVDVDLADYMFSVGMDDSEKYFEFPISSAIEANQYSAFYNLDIKFTLKNTTDRVRLYSIDKAIIDEAPPYENPKADEAWAKFDGLWQYTNRPSPNGENLAYFKDTTAEADVVEVESCGPNQYRNPETNRCKNIVNTTTILVPCKDGQYRSEETNRCRNIVSDVVEYIPCPEGQERNPETNRCRSIASASVLGTSVLAPCPEGQERNPETNRCRTVVSKIPEAAYAAEAVNQSSDNNVLWWSLGAVGAVAIFYGIWEWRSEIIKKLKQFGIFLHLVK